MKPIQPPFNTFILVCTNNRTEKSSCAHFNSETLAEKLKLAVREAGLLAKVVKTGCLGACHDGISVAIMPNNTWFAQVREGDIPAIIQEAKRTQTHASSITPPASTSTIDDMIEDIFNDTK